MLSLLNRYEYLIGARLNGSFGCALTGLGVHVGDSNISVANQELNGGSVLHSVILAILGDGHIDYTLTLSNRELNLIDTNGVLSIYAHDAVGVITRIGVLAVLTDSEGFPVANGHLKDLRLSGIRSILKAVDCERTNISP